MIDTALELRGEGVRPDDVEAVELGVAAPVLRTIAEPADVKAAPPSGYAARFSGPFTFAAALAGGGGLGLDLDDFTDERARDPELLALAARVTCVADEALRRDLPPPVPGRRARAARRRRRARGRAAGEPRRARSARCRTTSCGRSSARAPSARSGSRRWPSWMRRWTASAGWRTSASWGGCARWRDDRSARGSPACAGRTCPPAVRERTEVVLCDTLGVGLAGARTAEHRALVAATDPPPGPARLLGGDGRAVTDSAAWLNAVAICSLELDEGSKFARGHPAVHAYPAALALADALGASGERLGAALVAGHEVGARFGRATTLHAGRAPARPVGGDRCRGGGRLAARPRRRGDGRRAGRRNRARARRAVRRRAGRHLRPQRLAGRGQRPRAGGGPDRRGGAGDRRRHGGGHARAHPRGLRPAAADRGLWASAST